METIAKAFISLGLDERSVVAIIGFNSPEWFMADLASVFANGIAAGIYPTSSPEACKVIMKDCKAQIVVVEDQKQLDKFLQASYLDKCAFIVNYLWVWKISCEEEKELEYLVLYKQP